MENLLFIIRFIISFIKSKFSRFIISFIKSKFSSFKAKNFVGKIDIQGLKRPTFLGIKAYVSSTSGEVANHVVLINFKYKNAVMKDLKALNSVTSDQIGAIQAKGFTIELINEAIEKLKTAFINNMDKETASKGSIAQNEAYTKVNSTIKIHNETGKIYIYALAISKVILENGNYKTVNSRPLTLCQNEVKKVLNFKTSKYRQFIVNKDNLSAVAFNGEVFQM